FEGGERPDYPFFGLGPRALESSRSRYTAVSFEESVGFAYDHEGSGIEATTSIKDIRFDARGDCCSDPSLLDQAAVGRVQIPQGFFTYTALRQGLRGSLDSRRPQPAPGTGVRVEAHAEHDVDVRDPIHHRWFRWGGAASAFVDLTGHNRVVGL